MKRVLLLSVLSCLGCFGQVIQVTCDGVPQGNNCVQASRTSSGTGVAYAEVEVLGLCYPNQSTPHASAYAFVTCGPSLAMVTGGASNSEVIATSYLSGIINDEGSYAEDCWYVPDGDGGEVTGQCISLADWLCFILGGFCDS